ncbi:hypothetical protein COCOBI_11-1060 [Coccomyxa sp. Obi]|nr:hypothetical protein COCOBI_11-1060 [Coccomyxa sp. Obi]
MSRFAREKQLQEGDPRLMQNVGIQEPSNAFSKDASDGPHDAASSGIVGPLGAGPSGYFITHDGSIVPRSERANSMAKWVEWLLRTEPLVLEHDQSSTSSPSLENITHALGAKAVAKSALKAGFAYGKTEIYVRTVKAMSYNEERHWQCAFELVNE